MNEWLQAALRAPAVLVTVAIVEGSVPREPGAKMLVTTDGCAGTIGGGHLEHRATGIARRMLEEGAAPRLERFALGPGLGQCCGGIAHLAFETADRDQLALLDARRHVDTIRVLALDAVDVHPVWAVLDAKGVQLAGGPVPAFDRSLGTHVFCDDHGRRWLADAMHAPRDHVMLFGAGHVGAAIVRALSDLPCRLTWVDERDDLFPADLPSNVTIEATDTPEALVEQAAPGTTFLVMTHSHALDLRLSSAILSRPGTDWFGLIGSSTKRRQFEHRLRERGIGQARLDAMVCPIGLPGITGKAPAVIAASCAAQLLTVWEARASGAASHLEVSPELN